MAQAGGKQAGRKKPQAFLYGVDPTSQRGTLLGETLGSCGIEAVWVGAERLGEQVGTLIGLPGFARTGAAYQGEAPEVEFMLLANMPDELIWKTLPVLRTKGLSIGLKAAATAHNRVWTLAHLIEEVSREHAAVLAQQAAARESNA